MGIEKNLYFHLFLVSIFESPVKLVPELECEGGLGSLFVLHQRDQLHRKVLRCKLECFSMSLIDNDGTSCFPH